jgi:hypothetical protein
MGRDVVARGAALGRGRARPDGRRPPHAGARLRTRAPVGATAAGACEAGAGVRAHEPEGGTGRVGGHLRRGAVAGGESALALRSCQGEAACRAGGDRGPGGVGRPGTRTRIPPTARSSQVAVRRAVMYLHGTTAGGRGHAPLAVARGERAYGRAHGGTRRTARPGRSGRRASASPRVGSPVRLPGLHWFDSPGSSAGAERLSTHCPDIRTTGGRVGAGSRRVAAASGPVGPLRASALPARRGHQLCHKRNPSVTSVSRGRPPRHTWVTGACRCSAGVVHRAQAADHRPRPAPSDGSPGRRRGAHREVSS